MPPRTKKPPSEPKHTPEQAAEFSRRGKKSRNKGAGFEREVATELRDPYPKAKRGLGQARAAGEVPDVEGTPYWLELKCYARAINVRAVMAQAEQAAAEHAVREGLPARLPVVIARKTGMRPDLVTMRMADWLALVRRVAELEDALELLG